MRFSAKKLTAVVLCLMMLLPLAACKKQEAAVPAEQQEETVMETEKTGIDKNAVAVKVGNKEITVGDVLNAYNSYIEMYQYYGYSAPTEPAEIESMQDNIVNELVSEKVLLVKAEELGCDKLTEEQEKELDETVEKDKEGVISQYLDADDTETPEEEKRAKAIELINADLATYGWNMNFEAYIEYMRNYYKEGYMLENLEALVKKDAVVADETVTEYYNSLLSSQKESFAADPAAYLTNEMNYEQFGGDPVVTVPEGFARIKVIEIIPKGELDADYTTLSTSMGDLAKEFGQMMLNAKFDIKRTGEILSEYKKDQKEANALFEAYMADARASAEGAYKKLQDGVPFDDVLKEVNPDSVYATNEVIGSKGYLIKLDGEDGKWDEEIRAAANKLKDGEFSELILTDTGCYIVFRVGEEKAGDKPLEEVQEAVKACALEVAQNTLWEEKSQEWAEDSSLVTKYEENYRAIGK